MTTADLQAQARDLWRRTRSRAVEAIDAGSPNFAGRHLDNLDRIARLIRTLGDETAAVPAAGNPPQSVDDPAGAPSLWLIRRLGTRELLEIVDPAVTAATGPALKAEVEARAREYLIGGAVTLTAYLQVGSFTLDRAGPFGGLRAETDTRLADGEGELRHPRPEEAGE